MLTRRSEIKTTLGLRQQLRRPLPSVVCRLEKGVWRGRRSYSGPHFIWRFVIRVGGISGTIQLFTGPMHRLGPKLLSFGKLNMTEQHLCLNPCRHRRSFNDTEPSLGNTIVLGAIRGVNSCLINSSLHTDLNLSPKNSPPLSDLTICTTERKPSARTLARKRLKAMSESDFQQYIGEMKGRLKKEDQYRQPSCTRGSPHPDYYSCNSRLTHAPLLTRIDG